MVANPSVQLLRAIPSGYLAHYVIDASIALKWVWKEEGSALARRYARGALENEMRLTVPTLFWYEVSNALRYGSREEQDQLSFTAPWRLLESVPIDTVDFAVEAFPRIMDLATQQQITVYDAAYVFLAQSLQVPLITADAKLVKRCTGIPYVWHMESI